MFKKVITFFILMLSISLIGCSKKPLSKQNFVLGTIVSITLYDHQSEAILNEAFHQLTELENLLSIHKEHTLIDTINQNAGHSPVPVDLHTYALIEKGIQYSELTDGAFDLTIGPLTNLWNIGSSNAYVPSLTEIQSILPYVNYKLVTLNANNLTIYLQKEGMKLDLGGIAKGYAADVVTQFLKASGVQSAIINIGGNVVILGDTPKTVGIQDPFNPRGQTLGTVQLANRSIVTSGIYERYLTDETGQTYHHILNPKTGYPFDNELASVTILSDFSIDGDALSTSAFALGLDKGLLFIEHLPNIEALFITKDHQIYPTSGFPTLDAQ